METSNSLLCRTKTCSLCEGKIIVIPHHFSTFLLGKIGDQINHFRYIFVLPKLSHENFTIIEAKNGSFHTLNFLAAEFDVLRMDLCATKTEKFQPCKTDCALSSSLITRSGWHSVRNLQ